MAVAAVAALLTGWVFDRVGPIVVGALPVVVVLVPPLAFSENRPLVILGCLVWGAAVGIQESTLKATVAHLVPPQRRATAYGVYAAVIGAAVIVGGTLIRVLYERSIAAVIIMVAVTQVVALCVLLAGRTLLTWGGTTGDR